ncbi:hypothetical protein SynRS9909_02686 [Synechococcus sp. RS9909]|nr:hypothetical protein SynRS9909_02686 [Synechococcus sp. RS9909]
MTQSHLLPMKPRSLRLRCRLLMLVSLACELDHRRSFLASSDQNRISEL